MKNNSITAKTEMRNPLSMHIDKMSTLRMLEIMQHENIVAVTAVGNALTQIERVCDIITPKMLRGGRLIYIGAGTSGRLGVLDAVECPPTFGVEQTLVVGIIAGGEECMFRASENAEDIAENGRKDLSTLNITQNDSVIGISANGNAAYVIDALSFARERGAAAIALVNNPGMKIEEIADITIVLDTGAEVITGSTRMKAGTSQKLTLNMISTSIMIKLGKVYENMMINLKPSNAKLKERAIDIVCEISKVSHKQAVNFLGKNDWNIRNTVEEIKDKDNREQE